MVEEVPGRIENMPLARVGRRAAGSRGHGYKECSNKDNDKGSVGACAVDGGFELRDNHCVCVVHPLIILVRLGGQVFSE